ncbi:MAG: CotH kinase family protein [Chitinispirillales bacterium]|jgi:hypothetical protein|nr:CotH kinase family protein [Chitinispirillales bacterium]
MTRKTNIVKFLVCAFLASFLFVACNNDRPTDYGVGNNGNNGGDNGGDDNGDRIFLGDPPVIVNEINAINTNFRDEFDDTPGWVELYNPADTAVDLGGFYLTNNVMRKMWVFGDVIMEPRSYVVVFLSGANRPNLASGTGGTDLIGAAIGAWSWADSELPPAEGGPGNSTVEFDFVANTNISGTLTSVANQTLGWSTAMVMLKFGGWTELDVIDISDANQIMLRGYLSEGRRLSVRLAETGRPDYQGWGAIITGTGIENDLYTIPLPIADDGFPNYRNIYGLRFSNPDNSFGTIEFNFTSIRAVSGGNTLHATFQANRNGGSLYLMDSQDRIRDSLAYPAAVRGLSYAQMENGSWRLSSPTPGAANTGEFYDGVEDPPAPGSLPNSGFYENNLSFTIPSEGGSTIYCDTTGRLPTTSSAIRSGTTLNLTRTTMMRCIQFREGHRASDPIMRTYIIDDNLTESSGPFGGGGANIGRRRPSLPIVSIAVDPRDMFDPTVGLYSLGPNAQSSEPYFGANFWAETELPIHIDFFEDNVQHAWSYPAGIRIFGGWSRLTPKKSVLISFRSEYGGPNRLNYPLLPEFPHLTEFKHFLLRNNGNNAGLDYIRCMLMTSLTEGLEIEYQRGRAAIVYFNGRYFGIHNIRERSNADYYRTNFGIYQDFIDVVDGAHEPRNGSIADFLDIMNWLEGVSLENDNNFRTLGQRIDIDNYTNYIQSQIYYINKDWPGNNLKAWRTTSTAPASRWRWFLYDLDHGWGSFGSNHSPGVAMLDFVTEPNGPDWPNPPHSTLLTRKLFENQSYRDAFVNRFSLLIATYFATPRVEARIAALMAPIESEIPLDRARWRFTSHSGGDWRWNPTVQQEWYNSLYTFARNRPAQMRTEIERFFALSGGVNFTLSANGGGNVLVHNLEVLNRSATFRAYPSVPMAIKAVPNAGMVFDGWSDGNSNAERVVTIGGATTLTANFRPASF